MTQRAITKEGNQITSTTISRPKILFVEDEVDIALLFKTGLELDGKYRVDISNSPQEALHHLKSNTYDLIIIDIIMPEMSGFEFYNIIKKNG